MDNYITGTTIKELREKQHMTQSGLAEKIGVSDKAVSKWETGKGLPDITLIEPLAEALGISVMELLSGEFVTNGNRSANMQKTKIYVCPICGNVIRATGEAVISCCGITLPAMEAEEPDEEHLMDIDRSDGEYYVVMDHEMTKSHFVSFIAYATGGTFEMIKLYPEGNAEARFRSRGHGYIYSCCNRHGLMRRRV
ncbi:MAG: helix-turn-helix domain-containing protein [Eubacteriaceae bacterium]|nr:helix-turn-helix domain-containing protein [Eubacteriaceae bacterium]